MTLPPLHGIKDPGIIEGNLKISSTRVAGGFTTNGTTSSWEVVDTSAPVSVVIGLEDEFLDRIITIKDASLNAGVNNITITAESGALLEGASFYLMTKNGACVSFKFDGDQWLLYGTAERDLKANYVEVDSINVLNPAAGGEHLLYPNDSTYDFIDNKITGQPPLFFNALRIPNGVSVVLQAPLTLKPIIYLGSGAFIRSNQIEIYVQNNIVIAAPFSYIYDLTGNETSSVVFIENFAQVCFGAGSIKKVPQITIETINFLDWVEGLRLSDFTLLALKNASGPPVPNGLGPMFTMEGESVSQVVVSDGNAAVLSGQSFLNISPSIGDFATVGIRSNGYSSAFGGDFFYEGKSGFIVSATDNSETGSILSFSDNGVGGTTVTTTAALPVAIVDGRKITQSGTTNYNNTYTIFNVVPGVSYDIAAQFVGDDATGTFDFNSVTFTTDVAHTLVDGDAVDIDNSYIEYNVGRVIFDALGAVFSVDNVIFVPPGGVLTGTWATSIKQDDTRCNVFDNGDQPNTAQILDILLPADETVNITAIGVPEYITTWAPNALRQFTLNPPGEDIGTVRFNGNNMTASLYAGITGNMTVGTQTEIRFGLYRKPQGGVYSLIGVAKGSVFINKQQTVTLVFSAIELSQFDVLKIGVINIDSTEDFVARAGSSITIQLIAEGF